MESKKPKNPVDQVMTKKVDDYQEVIKLLDELAEYLKPIVGADNEEVNKRIHEIRFKLIMMPMLDLIQTTLQSSMSIFMAGKRFKDIQKDFNKDFENTKGYKEFEKFMKRK